MDKRWERTQDSSSWKGSGSSVHPPSITEIVQDMSKEFASEAKFPSTVSECWLMRSRETSNSFPPTLNLRVLLATIVAASCLSSTFYESKTRPTLLVLWATSAICSPWTLLPVAFRWGLLLSGLMLSHEWTPIDHLLSCLFCQILHEWTPNEVKGARTLYNVCCLD